jgi:redox-sensitive bicupin YhaK (pirin superfamily)
VEIRLSDSRGHAQHGWLESFHSFSFNRYYDPSRMGFSVLRVINDDFIQPANGFGMHSHQDMEIITYMLQGAVEHRDSLGNGAIIEAGDVQRMTAGTGIVHSEVNPSETEQTHLLQIWLAPSELGLTPSYEDKKIPFSRKLNQWCLIASSDARDDSLIIHQDVDLWATYLSAGQSLNYEPKVGRSLYLQMATGMVNLNGASLQQGDAAVFAQPEALMLEALNDAEILLFDLPHE